MRTKEERVQYSREYYLTHREEKLAYQRQYAAKRKEQDPEYVAKHNESAQRYRTAHPGRSSLVHRKSRYGITHSEMLVLLEAQGGRCKICGEAMTRPCLDHDHATKEIRGLLCPRCNTGLGMFKDNIGLLDRAKYYLVRSRP